MYNRADDDGAVTRDTVGNSYHGYLARLTLDPGEQAGSFCGRVM